MMYGVFSHVTFCVVILLIPQCAAQTGLSGYLTVDNDFTLYADGVFVASDTHWPTQHPINLNTYPKVLAIYARNRGGIEGIVASFNTGVVSDKSWRCRAVNGNPDQNIPGWRDIGYDDSNWPAADEIVVNGGGSWSFTGSVDVSPAARWIWTRNRDRDIVCRVSPTRCFLNELPCSCNWGLYSMILTVPDEGDQYLRVNDCVYTSNADFGTQRMACCRSDGTFRVAYMIGSFTELEGSPAK